MAGVSGMGVFVLRYVVERMATVALVEVTETRLVEVTLDCCEDRDEVREVEGVLEPKDEAEYEEEDEEEDRI